MELTAQNVHDVFMDCLYDDELIKHLKPGEAPEGAVIVEGVMMKVGFEPNKLGKHKDDIKEMLTYLPDEFFHDKGGGYSFLAAPVTKDGPQWGEHRNIDELLMLGLASNFIQYCLPRDMWSVLPGSLPYFVVNLEGFPPKI